MIKSRQIVCTIMIGGIVVPQFFSVRVSIGLAQPYAKATLVLPKVIGDYNDAVEISFGAIPGNGNALRFRGRRRDPDFDLSPRSVSIDCVGTLSKAAEFFNAQDPSTVGGLMVQDMFPTSTNPNGTMPADQIRIYVLEQAGLVDGVDFDAGNIGCTGRLYGGAWVGTYTEFIWKSGTPSAEEMVSNGYIQRAGESALDYQHRYDEIEAMWDGAASGGFYRLVESLGGQIYCVLVGGRPAGDFDVDPGAVGSATQPAPGPQPMIFEENKNILSARYKRQYPGGNRCMVQGCDTGIGGAFFFEAPGGNCRTNPLIGGSLGVDLSPYMLPTDYFYDRQPPSSSMIEWDTHANQVAGSANLTADDSGHPDGVTQSGAIQAGLGMDCETVAQARLLEIDRITVSGQLETAEDWLIGPGQTHAVQGAAGLPDRLGTGEPVWCQGAEYSLTLNDDGAPVLSCTPSHLGGGVTDAMLQDVPAD